VEFSAERVRLARTVIKWAPELAQAVLSGAHPLDRAYEIAAFTEFRERLDGVSVEPTPLSWSLPARDALS
jgi:hypothetical protein